MTLCTQYSHVRPTTLKVCVTTCRSWGTYPHHQPLRIRQCLVSFLWHIYVPTKNRLQQQTAMIRRRIHRSASTRKLPLGGWHMIGLHARYENCATFSSQSIAIESSDCIAGTNNSRGHRSGEWTAVSLLRVSFHLQPATPNSLTPPSPRLSRRSFHCPILEDI